MTLFSNNYCKFCIFLYKEFKLCAAALFLYFSLSKKYFLDFHNFVFDIHLFHSRLPYILMYF